MKKLRIFLLPFVLLALGPSASAQILNVTNSTSTPIPGAGHDYIKAFSETVNPSNGSVSIRVQTPTSTGRGITLPFSFAYDSNGAAHISTTQAPPVQPVWRDNSAYLSQAGWSYTIPILSNVFVAVPANPPHYCYYYKDYVFQDPTGGRHSLKIADVTTPSTCTSVVPRPYQVVNGGDDYYRATLDTTISDAEGTVYTFIGPDLDHIGIDQAESSLPYSIEDRNGNQIVVTDLGLPPNGVAGKFTVTDSLGRTLLSSSGFGVSGNTLAVSGLSTPYSITWGSSSLNFSVNAWLLFNSGGCTAGFPSDTGTENVIKKITLPNGQFYQFSYDSAYGVLNKITYPTGGYVQYTWGVNGRSEAAVLTETAPGGLNSSCWYQYDVPAVTHRYVSFDGTHVALQQDFRTRRRGAAT